MYQYVVRLVRVVDGDTIDVDVDLGFYLTQRMRIRLAGLDTPEIRGPSKTAGLAAKKFVEDELGKAKVIAIRSYKIGRYGRFIADVYYSPRAVTIPYLFRKRYHLNRKLLDANHARPV